MRFPDDETRHAIIGRTGSGKTQAGLYALSRRSFDRMPWTILDFKRDKLISKIPRLEEISIRDAPAKRPGLYVARPNPLDKEDTEAYLWRAWERGRVGTYIDEGYMIGRHSLGLQTLLTQGRSIKCPVIYLSQKPVWVSPFMLSESEYIQCFHLTDPNNIKTMREWFPMTRHQEFPRDYHSLYYDVRADQMVLLKPVPDVETIYNRFDDRIPPRTGLFRGLFANAQPPKTPRRSALEKGS